MKFWGAKVAANKKKKAANGMKTVGWWDIENASVPVGVDASSVYTLIKKNLAKAGFTGPLELIAYAASEDSLSTRIRDYLPPEEVKLRYVGNNIDQAADMAIVYDVEAYCAVNSSPHNILLIARDGGYEVTVTKLILAGYTVLLAYIPGTQSQKMLQIINVTWTWRNLLGLTEDPQMIKAMKNREMRKRKEEKTARREELFEKEKIKRERDTRSLLLVNCGAALGISKWRRHCLHIMAETAKQTRDAERAKKIKRERDTKYLSLVKREADIGISKWRRLYFHMMAQQVDTLVTSQKTETDVAPQKTMEFWGAKVAANTPFDVILGEDKLVHITQVSLDLNDCEDDIAKLFIKVGDGGRYTIGSLSLQKANHMSVDLIIDEDFILSHSLKKGNVHFTGYTTPNLEALVSEGKDKKTAGKRKARC